VLYDNIGMKTDIDWTREQLAALPPAGDKQAG
jgi:hypothetical protein